MSDAHVGTVPEAKRQCTVSTNPVIKPVGTTVHTIYPLPSSSRIDPTSLCLVDAHLGSDLTSLDYLPSERPHA
jgi:hypothetical protein